MLPAPPCAPRSLILIDGWADERFRDGRSRVEARFAEATAAGQVEILQGPSVETLGRPSPGSLDMVYIDTAHSFATTRAELDIAAKAPGSGGRLAGHDFCVGNIEAPMVCGTIPTVHDFCIAAD